MARRPLLEASWDPYDEIVRRGLELKDGEGNLGAALHLDDNPLPEVPYHGIIPNWSRYEGGVLQDLFEAKHRLQQILERGMHTRTQYDDSRTILKNASEPLSRSVESFRNYLLRQGIAVD